MNIQSLDNFAFFVSDKIDSSEITISDYVTTDNLLQNKQGLEIAGALPISNVKLIKYEKGDTLISNIRPYLKKIWNADKSGGCSNDVLVFRAKANVEPTYLYYSLFQDSFFDYVMTGVKGTKMPRGDKSQMINFLLTMPSIPTQQKIANILSTLDRKIALNQQINQKLEAMAKQLYDYWFVQFDFPDENGKPYKSSGGEMVWCEALKREVPKGWDKSTIGEIENNIVTGKTPSKEISEYFNGNIPFITIGDIRGNTFVVKTEETLSEIGANSQPNKYLPEDSICVTCIATVGLVGFTTTLSQTNQQINTVICSDEKNRYYLYFAILDYFSVAGAKSGNTFANMNKNDFSNIEIIKPTNKVLHCYFSIVNPIFEKIKFNSLEIQKLTQLRDFLLPMLMNGQISVK